MIDVQVIIDRLQAETAYTIDFSRDIELNDQVISELPVVYVGYATMDSRNPNAAIAYSFLEEHGENLIQSFDVKIVSTVENFSPVWINVYRALNTYMSDRTGATSFTTGLTYAQGGILGLSNGKIWHVDRWRIGLPTTNPLI